MLSKLVPRQPKRGPDGYIYGSSNQKGGMLLFEEAVDSARQPNRGSEPNARRQGGKMFVKDYAMV